MDANFEETERKYYDERKNQCNQVSYQDNSFTTLSASCNNTRTIKEVVTMDECNTRKINCSIIITIMGNGKRYKK